MPAGPTSAPALACPRPTVTVHDAAGLRTALAGARPGTVLRLADGRYDGTFTARTSGTAAAPIFVCGGRRAVLDAGGVRSGYGFHLDGAKLTGTDSWVYVKGNGFHFAPARSNIVGCDNRVVRAGAGLSNVRCTG